MYMTGGMVVPLVYVLITPKERAAQQQFIQAEIKSMQTPVSSSQCNRL